MGMGTRAEPTREEAALPEDVFEEKEAVHVNTVSAHPILMDHVGEDLW